MTDTTTAPEQPTTSRGIALEHDGQKYTGQLARVHSTRLSPESVHVVLTWKEQTVGLPIPAPVTLDSLTAVLAVAGVDAWEQLPGATVIALFTVDENGANLHGLAHTIDDVVMITNPITEKPKTRTRSPKKPADHQEPAAKPTRSRSRSTKAQP